jgi:hypothetical protein
MSGAAGENPEDVAAVRPNPMIPTRVAAMGKRYHRGVRE